MRVFKPDFGILVLLVQLAWFPAGCFGLVVLNGIECFEGEGGGIRVLILCRGVPMDVRPVESHLL